MRQRLRNIRLVASTLLLEAIRRREIYVIVCVTALLIVALRFVHFFNITELGKFYREISLRTMNVTTALTVIILAARQLPREFRLRTIYPLLAKPISRIDFLLGKYLGVVAAGCFCYGLFMALFLAGSLTLAEPVHTPLFVQSVYLQVLSLAVVAALTFLLSMLLNTDAALTLSAVLYLASQVLMNLMSFLHDYVGSVSQLLLVGLHFVIPQLTLFDASARVVHSMSEGRVIWSAIPGQVVWQLTAYAAAYILIYIVGSYLLFRRRPL